MTKYTVVDYYIKGGQLHTDQVSKWFDSIQDAEAARVVILNERHPNVIVRESKGRSTMLDREALEEFKAHLKDKYTAAQSLRVVQYDFK